MCLRLGEFRHADAEARRLRRTRDLLGEGYLAFVAFLKVRKLSSVHFCYLRGEELRALDIRRFACSEFVSEFLRQFSKLRSAIETLANCPQLITFAIFAIGAFRKFSSRHAPSERTPNSELGSSVIREPTPK